jgi:hypothetical protein
MGFHPLICRELIMSRFEKQKDFEKQTHETHERHETHETLNKYGVLDQVEAELAELYEVPLWRGLRPHKERFIK